jgi:hypothetical protein
MALSEDIKSRLGYALKDRSLADTIATEIDEVASVDAADLAKIDGITNGTGAVSKALVLDPSGYVSLPSGGSIDQRFAEVVTTTNVIGATENGKTFYLDLAGGFVSTLPAPALGLAFDFVLKTSVTSSMTIVTTSSSNIICGQVYTVDVNSATDPGFTATADQDTITFVANKAVKGDRVRVVSDGTSWYAYGFCSVFDAITLSQAG